MTIRNPKCKVQVHALARVCTYRETITSCTCTCTNSSPSPTVITEPSGSRSIRASNHE